ncbi:hypothetical protein EJ07DRAFT_135539 [Lizonia empirigonia]|nr:hypothetical protein EJ07DRAFT_135539 [Lizonia empirigonia]
MSKPFPFTSILSQPVSEDPSTGITPAPTSKQAAQGVDIKTALPLLPASYRTKDDILQVPDTGAEFLWYELGVDRLNVVHPWLWVAGRPMPPRALHHQELLGREVVVTERMDMHLVWSRTRIFIRPLPRFLLEPRFWVDHLSCKDDCKCPPIVSYSPKGSTECEEAKLRRCALGFLLSYAALVSHESDFFIAKDTRLLPDQISWMQWKAFVKEILEHDAIYEHVNQRYVYGELRLNRLNAIYRLTGRAVFRGYQSEYSQYSSFFRDNFTWLASVLAYMVIVLTAMQVGLATSALASDKTFQAASYGFTVFVIVVSLAAVMIVFAVFLFLFVYNWIETLRYVKVRQKELQRRN